MENLIEFLDNGMRVSFFKLVGEIITGSTSVSFNFDDPDYVIRDENCICIADLTNSTEIEMVVSDVRIEEDEYGYKGVTVKCEDESVICMKFV